MKLISSIISHIKRKPITTNRVFSDIGKVITFKKNDLLKVVKTCPNGSRILIDRRTWIQVYHNEVLNEPTNQPG